MRVIGRNVLWLGLGLGLLAIPAAAGADEVTQRDPRGDASPHAAFEARRQAVAARDWRTAFASLTPSAQDREIEHLAATWIYFGEGMGLAPFVRLGVAERQAAQAKLRAIMQRHGLGLSAIDAAYDQAYHAAHGVDLAQRKAEVARRRRERLERYLKDHPREREEYEAIVREDPTFAAEDIIPVEPGEAPDPTLPTVEDDLMFGTIKAMTARVADKAALYREATEILAVRGQEAPELIYRIGGLQGVVVAEDSARGWVEWHQDHQEPTRLLRTFRRVDGRWLNDTETWDYTPFAPAPAAK